MHDASALVVPAGMCLRSPKHFKRYDGATLRLCRFDPGVAIPIG
jgi:hypothetical protein